MKLVVKIIQLSLVVILTGCNLEQPQNATEFRAGVPGAFMAKVEKYEVSQPFEQVAARF